ncbi:MAG TPA: 50S ribosomal protein L4, partial [Anaerolineales bacterium]|nr:50S ribosomal protein L4 [Anaerolineales bacterium]
MKVDVLNMEGKKVSEVELPATIFEAPINVDLMHQAYVRQMANARLGTHETKVRSEVAGGGSKPWKQKGTGRARQGSRRAAQWIGGGRIHTP